MTIRIFLISTLMFFVLACNKESGESPNDSGFHPLFQVKVLFPSQGLGDRSFVDDVYEAVELAAQDFSFEVEYIVPPTIEEGATWLKDYVQSTNEASFIIAVGNQFAPAVDSLKGHFNGHKLLLIEGIAKEYDGLASILYYTYAPSYIAGYMSAKLTQNCRATSISGFNAPFLTQFIEGYEEGVRDAGGTVANRYYLADDFSGFEMPDSAYRLTKQILTNNDLIFGLATGSNFGIINAIRESSEQKYAIGINSDQSWMGYHVVTGSVINDFRNIIRDYIGQYQLGTFNSGSFYLSMEGQYTEFRLNSLVLNQEPDQNLVNIAIEKEKAWWGKRGYGFLSKYHPMDVGDRTQQLIKPLFKP